MEQGLAETGENWREKVAELQALLADIQPKLIDAEARLAERFAEINRFELTLRTKIGPLVQRLEILKDEIRGLRRKLRQMQEDWFFAKEQGENDFVMAGWNFSAEAGAAAAGDYRYMGPHVPPPSADLSADKQEDIKRLYRQLARRFHPDLASDEAEREYRTGVMMRINAAYTAGDLEKLQAIAAEPDNPDHMNDVQSDQQLAEALLRELVRCRRRLAEIEEEFASLARHRNAVLQRRAQRAAAAGRDLLAEMAVELQEEIAQSMVERDVLLQEIDAFSYEQPEISPDTFADTIFDLSLEQMFDLDDDYLAAEDWTRRRSDRYIDEDDILDDLD
ncbi:MAG: J domain-containing protein [Ardenticatenaceae bacterium]|nr:J domain-containing protein [Ardenticatenaceae bacterium]